MNYVGYSIRKTGVASSMSEGNIDMYSDGEVHLLYRAEDSCCEV